MSIKDVIDGLVNSIPPVRRPSDEELRDRHMRKTMSKCRLCGDQFIPRSTENDCGRCLGGYA